jgi:hypothetical protein
MSDLPSITELLNTITGGQARVADRAPVRLFGQHSKGTLLPWRGSDYQMALQIGRQFNKTFPIAGVEARLDDWREACSPVGNALTLSPEQHGWLRDECP